MTDAVVMPHIKSALTLKTLIIRVFVILPFAYALWYYAGGALASMFAPLVSALCKLFLVGKVGALELSGTQFVFPIKADAAQFGGRAAELLLEVNSRLYTFGAPVFVAVMLAARASFKMFLIGFALLLPFQAWGVFFDLLKDISLQSVQGIPLYQEFAGTTREFIIIAYQFGTLILPMLAPISLAAICARRQLETVLVPQRQLPNPPKLDT
jgi:hypothetical protein